MNEDQKNKAKQAHSKLTTWLEGLGVPSNWAKIGASLAIGAAIGALSTCQQSCTTLPQPTAAQVQAAHSAYHALTGEPCTLRIIAVENTKK